MSTRVSIYYKEPVHIYLEYADDWIHLEYEKDDVLVNVALMPVDDWETAGFPSMARIHIVNRENIDGV